MHSNQIAQRWLRYASVLVALVWLSAPAFAETKYTGKRIDFTANDVDIRQFLDAIAEVSKRDIVSDTSLWGTVNGRFHNVPWDEVLDHVLRERGLRGEDDGTRIRILYGAGRDTGFRAAPAGADLNLRRISVNSVSAEALSKPVRDLLTPGLGTLSTDERTNVLIVRDTPEVLSKVEDRVRELDVAQPQVVLEARIVEASIGFSQSLGVPWSTGTSSPGGNPAGLTFAGLPTVSDTGHGEVAASHSAVNMPTTVMPHPISFRFGVAGGAGTLRDLLTRAELAGEIKTVSIPRLVTLDNTVAPLPQTIGIPCSAEGCMGAASDLMCCPRLALTWTTQVMADGSVLLRTTAANSLPGGDQVGSSRGLDLATSKLLVRPGEAMVIGGVSTRRLLTIDCYGPPFYARIPIIGALFRPAEDVSDGRAELLVFITPRVVQPAVSASNP